MTTTQFEVVCPERPERVLEMLKQCGLDIQQDGEISYCQKAEAVEVANESTYCLVQYDIEILIAIISMLFLILIGKGSRQYKTIKDSTQEASSNILLGSIAIAATTLTICGLYHLLPALVMVLSALKAFTEAYSERIEGMFQAIKLHWLLGLGALGVSGYVIAMHTSTWWQILPPVGFALLAIAFGMAQKATRYTAYLSFTTMGALVLIVGFALEVLS